MDLPKLFLDRMKKLLGNEFNLFLKFQKQPLLKTIRINTLKIKVKDFLSLVNWDLERLKFYKEGFIVRNKYTIGNSLYHFLGYIYIQEASSMIPPIVLNPKPKEWVLDMCAAPGSKTTQIAQMMKNEGVLFANEISLKRISALGLNLQRCGVANTILTKMNGTRFPKTGYKFDKVLVDAPCSSEGAMRKDAYSVLSMWGIKTINSLSKLQKRLILSGFDSLKEKGTLVYSTCTMAPEENEEVLDFLLKNRPCAKIVKVNVKNLNHHNGITRWEGKEFDNSVKNAIRIYPQDNNTEGFFISKVVKKC